MRGEGGEWLQPPPGWPPIIGHATAASGDSSSSKSTSLANTLPAYLSFPPWEQLAETDNLAGRRSGISTSAEPQQAEPAWLGTVMEEQAFLRMFGVR